MNIKEYIEQSGMLEEYVLGHLSKQDEQAVACLATSYPEINTEIELLRESLTMYAKAHAKQPPAALKDSIFAQMVFDEEEELETEQYQEAEEKQEVVLEKVGRVIPFWAKLSVAASLLLAVFGVWTYSQNQELETLAQTLESKIQTAESKNKTNESILSSFYSPDVQVVKLKGMEAHPECSVIVHWNQKDNSVALQVTDLPIPAPGKQYQLWIIGENGPEDMGMLSNDFKDKVLAMKNVSGKPSAFAITLEKEGGVPSPTLEQLYVLATV